MSVLLRSLVFSVLFIGTVLVALPYWIIGRGDRAPVPLTVRAIGLLLGAAGAAGVLWCIRDFAVRGRGTPAPWDPPKHLVVAGPYRYVRNPMYVASLIVLAGEALFFGSSGVAIYAAALWLAYHLRVVLSEEPALRRQFGPEYEAYRAVVPRWIPRFA
ncbi:MAG TPA: isoprenylcysteine carboxylmethyltransferase family protein [Thermoanaerobaculia bacterium]|jgi:protein-S-isoprenylcysteine O-methyltransferase Ste14|nr:isoprenylcysteine carboxylmethyltransferase family protein [Thermoanaerobaculia bacterium]